MNAVDIVKIKRDTFKKAGELAKSRIIEDANNGVFQNDKASVPKYSDTYRNYKVRGMVGFRGKKLKQYKGKSINTSPKPNMRLTGETLRRIAVRNIKNGFRLIFARGGIVEGNADKGYDIYDLNDKNYNSIMNFIANRLDINIKKYTEKPITIKVGSKQT